MDGVSILSRPAYTHRAENEPRQQLPFQEANQVICRKAARRLPSGFGRSSAGRCGKIDRPNPRRTVVNQTQRSCVEIRFGSHESQRRASTQPSTVQLVANCTRCTQDVREKN